ncbi:hypothetical protein D9758_010254 [Tetrapyrgos nigripes]|uniref:Hydrophobin n=1 Tax=Tetrapyrgos nigripes TaxID=182062 RepID=A0A8H5GAA1_9AGAR|nr:hypothetical protein D9758_010254 [Tetrapyrgos nigripes]
MPATSHQVATITSLLGLNLGAITALIRLGCTPINALGVGGTSCAVQPACWGITLGVGQRPGVTSTRPEGNVKNTRNKNTTNKIQATQATLCINLRVNYGLKE